LSEGIARTYGEGPNGEEVVFMGVEGVAPVADWFTFEDLRRDPYPVFERLRSESPVAYSPEMDRYFVTRFADCNYILQNQDLFSQDQEPRSKMKRTLGPTLLTKADPEHAEDRAAINSVLRPRVAQEVWAPIFAGIAEELIDAFVAKGPGADLVEGLAVPYAAACLRAVIGLPGAELADMSRWSASFVAGAGNHAAVPEIFEISDANSATVDALIDEAAQTYRAAPDHSMLAAMVTAGMPMDIVRANTKLAIAGGINEPQHALVNGVWALDRNPADRDRALADPELFTKVFDETMRWLPPITSLNRQACADVTLSGVTIPSGSSVFAAVGSANRDAEHFEAPDEFRLDRGRAPHLGFGGGTHLCAGSWVARAAVAGVMWPRLYARLPGLRPTDPEKTTWTGYTFRGIESLPVTWEI
jgi:cytochrome P450